MHGSNQLILNLTVTVTFRCLIYVSSSCSLILSDDPHESFLYIPVNLPHLNPKRYVCYHSLFQKIIKVKKKELVQYAENKKKTGEPSSTKTPVYFCVGSNNREDSKEDRWKAVEAREQLHKLDSFYIMSSLNLFGHFLWSVIVCLK